jgi:hypothetical protein
MRRTLWGAVVVIAVVLATWLVLYLAIGVGGDSGPSITRIDRNG